MQDDVGVQLPMAAGFDPSPVSSPEPMAFGAAPMGMSAATQDIDNAAKAAIVVRLLLSEGADLPLEQLPENLQAKLTRQMSKMRLVDRATLDSVVDEFKDRVNGVGLHFPHGLHETIELLNGRISQRTADKLRRAAGMPKAGDPWPKLCEQEEDDLVQIMQSESIEVAAVLLSKLETEKAAGILTRLPGPLARKITHAVALTSNVTPDAVVRIGQSLAEQFDHRPETAFDAGPDERLGAILNRTTAAVRDEVLEALDDVDKPFGSAVKRHIFTFEHIPDRIQPKDVPKLIRAVDQVVLTTALAGSEAAGYGEVPQFIYNNLSARMSDNLREEATEIGTVRPEDAEAAMVQFVEAIGRAVEEGELKLIPLDGPDVVVD